MAEVITRFKLETTQYDSKLRSAAKGLADCSHQAMMAGKEFGKFTQKSVESARAFGNIATSATNTKDKVKELVGAFNDVAKAYNVLTKEQQQSDFGKAMSESMQKLQERIREAKQEMQDMGDKAKGGVSNALDNLAGKFGLNIKQLTGFGVAIGASKVALDAARDAFFSSESNVDEWGRTVAASEAIYESFLQSLNNGNFSGFITNIGRVTQAAKDAYNALDELGTRMTIINPERAKLQAKQQELRATIKREGAGSEAGQRATAQLRALEPQLAKSYSAESRMNYNAFEKLVRERLAEGGINLNQRSFNQLMKTFSDDAAFQRLRANARGSVTSEAVNAYNPNAVRTRRTVDTRNTEQRLLDLFTDKWRQQNSGYLTAAFNAQGASFTNMLGNARYLKTGGGGSGKGSGTVKETDQEKAAKRMAEAQHRYELAIEKAKAEMDGGVITEKDFKSAQKRAAESLFEAADDAYQTFADPEYLKVKENARKEFVSLGGEVKTLTETEKASQKTAREQEQAQKKLADAQQKRADALKNGNLKDYYTATKQVEEAKKEVSRLGGSSAIGDIEQDEVNIPVNFAFNQENLNALIENLKAQLGSAEVGSEMFNTLAQKLGDATVMSKAVQSGIQQTLDERTGTRKRDKKGDSPMDKASKALGGLNSIAGGLEKMGVELPSEFQNLIGVIEGAMSVIQGVQTIISVFQTSAIVANTAALNANTAAMVWTSFLGFKTGGIVPHAAQGFVPGNNYSDNVPLMVSSGELILNRAQQGNLASQLEGGADLGNLNLSAVIRGEQIRLVLNNNGRRTGRGEYVQSKNLKQ